MAIVNGGFFETEAIDPALFSEEGDSSDSEKTEKDNDEKDNEGHGDGASDDGNVDSDADGDQQDGDDDKTDGEEKEKETRVELTDETEVEIEPGGEDSEKVKLADLRQAYIDRRDQQADYTQKTQELADRRREFEAQEQTVTDRINKMMTDPYELVKTFRRKNPKVWHEAVTIYATEYQELQELAKENPAAYQEYLQKQHDEFTKLNQKEESERNQAKEIRRIRALYDDNLKPALTKAGLLPEKRSKVYEGYAIQAAIKASRAYCEAHPNERITKEMIYRVAESLKKNADLQQELEVDKARITPKRDKKNGKPEPKQKARPQINKVGDRGSRREQRENVTHENFFERFSY
jgi:hypothetical protein